MPATALRMPPILAHVVHTATTRSRNGYDPWFADEKISMQRLRRPCPKSCIWSVVIWSQQSASRILGFAKWHSVLMAPPNFSCLGGFMDGFSLLWHGAFHCYPWLQAHYSHHLWDSLNGQSHWGTWVPEAVARVTGEHWAPEAGFQKQRLSVNHFSFPCFFFSPRQDIEARISCSQTDHRN